MKQDQNNFHFLRLFFATLVIFSHSFSLAGQEEIVIKSLNGQITYGGVAVNVFFIMSGYLVFISLKNSRSLLDYFWKRCLRLFPALFVMLLITLVVAVIVHTGDNIFRQRDFYTYLPSNMLLFNMHYLIGGVFVDNPYPKTINGSLWSLYYEFIMYLLAGLFFPFRNHKKLVLIILVTVYLFASYAYLLNPSFLWTPFAGLNIASDDLYRLACCFFSGAVISQLNLKQLNSPFVWMSCLLLLIVSAFFGAFLTVSVFVLPIFIISFGLSFFRPLFVVPGTIGDISYGVYIYGFLVQQTLMNYFDLNPYVLTLSAMTITYIFSIASWHIIEKPALSLKKVFNNSTSLKY